jgi:hypothetical protein
MLNITQDYTIFDNKETIYFQNSGESVVTIHNVVRRPAVIATETISGTSVYATAVEFLVWKDNAPSLNPKLNAIITDKNGKKYTVDLIDDGVLRTRWSVKATSLAGEGIN